MPGVNGGVSGEMSPSRGRFAASGSVTRMGRSVRTRRFRARCSSLSSGEAVVAGLGASFRGVKFASSK